MRKQYRRISPALVVSVLALVLALTGGAVAAGITGGQIVNNSITGKDVKNRSLTKTDFRGSVRGPRGPQGPQGAQGPQGPAGPVVLGRLVTTSASASYPAGAIEIATANCPPGHRVVSGGYTSASAGATHFVNTTYNGVSWSVGIDNFDSPVGADVTVFAHCAPAGQAIAAKHTSIAGRVASAIKAQRARH